MFDKNAFDESKLSPKGKEQLARLHEEIRRNRALQKPATREEALAQAAAGRRQRGLPPIEDVVKNDDLKTT